MGLKDRTDPGPDLGVVLELTRQPDGTARGEVEGVPVSVGTDHRARILLTGGWPGSIVSAPTPADAATVPNQMLLNRSGHPAWMGQALARALADAEVRAAVEALSSSALRVEVRDDALVVEWTAEADGPSIRRTVKALTRVARALPSAMAQVVEDALNDERATRQQAARRAQSPEERLSEQYAAFGKRLGRIQYGTVLWPVAVLLSALFVSIWTGSPVAVVFLPLPLGLAGFFYGLRLRRRLRFTHPCPRCGAPRSARAEELVSDPRCPQCRLGPSRPLTFRLANETDRIDL